MDIDRSLVSYLEKQKEPMALVSDGLFLYANNSFVHLLGYESFSHLATMTLLDICTDLDKAQLKQFLLKSSNTSRSSNDRAEISTGLATANGSVLESLISGFTLNFNGNNYLCLQLEASGEEDPSSNLSQSLSDDTPTAIVHDGVVVYANDAFIRETGFLNSIDIPQTLLDLSWGVSKEEVVNFLNAAKETSPSEIRKPELYIRDKQSKKAAILAGSEIIFNDEKCILLNARKPSSILDRPSLQKPVLSLSIVLLVLLVVVPNIFLPRAVINNSPKVYLPGNAPAVIEHDKLRQFFPNDEGIVLLFEGVGLFSNDFLVAINHLSNDLENISVVDKVISVTSQEHILGTEDGFLVEPLVDVDNLDSLEGEERRQNILSDRFASKLLVSDTIEAMAVAIFPYTMNDSFAKIKLIDQVMDLVQRHNLSLNLTAVAGELVTDASQTKTLIKENIKFVPITVVIGLVLIWLMFKRLIAVVLTGVSLAAVVNATLVLHVVFNKPVNMVSTLLAPLVSALTIAALVHLFNALQHGSSRGLMGLELVKSAINEVRRPALFATLTTVAGFASLGLSPIPPIAVFGVITALGVTLIYLVVYFLLPPILIKFDQSPWPKKNQNRNLLDRIVSAFYRTGIKYPIVTLTFFSLVLICGSFFIRNIVVETNLLEFFAPGHETRMATERVDMELVGTTPLEIAISSANPGGVVTPAALKSIKKFQQWAEARPEVDKTISLVDFIEEMNWAFNAEDDQFKAIPASGKLIKQYLFIYDGEDLADYVDDNYQITRVTMNVNVHGANQIQQLIADIRSTFNEISTDDSTLDWSVDGSGRMFAEQEDLLVEGQLNSVIGAVIIIFVLMLVQWRSIRDAAICMIPNLSPILLIFIIMGIAGIWLDMATAMIASVAVGIAIDDTIHVYHGFIQRVKRGISPVLAIARTYRQAGRAVMTTSLILCFQFSILSSSDFTPIAHFGFLTTFGLLTALFFDLLLLPAILSVVFLRAKAPSNPVTH